MPPLTPAYRELMRKAAIVVERELNERRRQAENLFRVYEGTSETPPGTKTPQCRLKVKEQAAAPRASLLRVTPEPSQGAAIFMTSA